MSSESVFFSIAIYEGIQAWDRSENMFVSVVAAQGHVTALSTFLRYTPSNASWEQQISC